MKKLVFFGLLTIFAISAVAQDDDNLVTNQNFESTGKGKLKKLKNEFFKMLSYLSSKYEDKPIFQEAIISGLGESEEKYIDFVNSLNISICFTCLACSCECYI